MASGGDEEEAKKESSRLGVMVDVIWESLRDFKGLEKLGRGCACSRPEVTLTRSVAQSSFCTPIYFRSVVPI
jgi:hypothetical protein